MIEIVNLSKEKPSKPYDFKVDRGTKLGNPFVMTSFRSREVVCSRYEEWLRIQLRTKPSVNVALNELVTAYKRYGKLRLFCWCAPKQCHAEYIKKVVEVRGI